MQSYADAVKHWYHCRPLIEEDSAACSPFLRQSSMIMCQVIDSRQASSDLSQGRLEVLCILKCVGKGVCGQDEGL